MPFNLTLKFEDGGAEAKIKGVETGLNKATDAANRGQEALGRLTKTARDVGAAGAKAGEDAAKGMEKAKAAAEGHGDTLTRLIHLAEAYVAVHQIESIVDGYVEIRNKTNSVSTSAENLNAVMDEQFRIAQETRSSWEDLAGTYQRISNAGRGLGLSQRQILDLTEELSMGMRLSGSSSREASMTMMELTHAFTVGTLTGREFRVMMKDAPALMHELQVVSGKTGAEFAEMGKHGKFTAQTLVEWFDKAKGTIADKFGQTIPTISEGFTLIRNAAERFFGSTAVGTGVMGALGSALKFVADHMETFGRVLLGVGEALIGLFVIEKIIVLVRALTVAIAANPLGAILVAITAGIALLRQFGDEINTNQKVWENVEGVFVTVGDKLFAIWELIKQLGAAIGTFLSESWSMLTSAFDDGIDSSGLEFSLRNVLTFLASFVDAAIGLFRFLGDTVTTVFGGIPVAITEVFVDLVRGALSVVEHLVNGVIDAINAAVRAYRTVRSYLPGGGDTPDKQDAASRENAERWARDMNAKYSLGGSSSGIGESQDDQDRRAAGMRAALAAGLHPTAAGFVPGQAPGGYGSSAGLSHVNLDFKTDVDGVTDAFFKKFGDDWKKDVKGTTVAKDMVTSLIDEVERIARDHAAKRVMDERLRPRGDISTQGNAPDAKAIDEKAVKAAQTAFDKLENQLRAITEASNPQSEAIEKLSHAHEILEKAVSAVNPKTKQHLLLATDAVRIYDNYRAKLEDALHPFDAWIRKQEEASSALRDNSEEQERAAKLQAFVAEMRQKTGGVGASAAEIELARQRIAVDQQHAEQMRAEQGFTQAILGPQHTYQVQLQALGDLLERGRIDSTQYGRAVDDVRASLLAATPAGKTFGGALEIALIKARQDAEAFDATLTNVLIDDLDKIGAAFISIANGGKVSWGQMINAMIQDIERLILKQLEMRALASLFPSLGGAGGDVASAIGSVIPSGGDAAPVVDAISSARTAPADVGAYPTQYADSKGGQAQTAHAAPVVVEVHNHYDESLVHAGMDSKGGRQIVMNTLRAEQPAVRSYSGIRR